MHSPTLEMSIAGARLTRVRTGHLALSVATFFPSFVLSGFLLFLTSVSPPSHLLLRSFGSFHHGELSNSQVSGSSCRERHQDGNSPFLPLSSFCLDLLEQLANFYSSPLQLACCDYHCAAVTTTGDVYTFGSKENGKLGLGRDTPSGSTGHVTQVTKFMDSDETTELANIKIGYVSCLIITVTLKKTKCTVKIQPKVRQIRQFSNIGSNFAKFRSNLGLHQANTILNKSASAILL